MPFLLRFCSNRKKACLPPLTMIADGLSVIIVYFDLQCFFDGCWISDEVVGLPLIYYLPSFLILGIVLACLSFVVFWLVRAIVFLLDSWKEGKWPFGD